MMTPLEQQFVEVVAREIYDTTEPPHSRCEWCAYSSAEKVAHDDYVRDERISLHTFSVRRSAAESPTPATDKLIAAKLLGMVEERNQSSIEAIVQAARRAVYDGDSEERRAEFSVDAFFRAIAREALGEGKVSEEFGEIIIGTHRADCRLEVPIARRQS